MGKLTTNRSRFSPTERLVNIMTIILHILVFVIGFWIGTYIYHKMTDGKRIDK